MLVKKNMEVSLIWKIAFYLRFMNFVVEAMYHNFQTSESFADVGWNI